MLVLGRSENQIIRIGDNVVVQVLRISKHQVSIGITAPNGVSIHREEIYQRIVAGKQSDTITLN